MKEIAQRLESILATLRPFPEVRICAVAKAQPWEAVKAAVDAGLRIVANNYAQEGQLLREKLAGSPVEWHFIGHIQSRKAKELIGYHCIQSLDRIKVAQALAAGTTKPLDVLLEVNIGEEAQKSGILPALLDEFLREMGKFPTLKVRGLMAIPPNTSKVEERRPYFKKMRALFESRKTKHGLSVLSMGMSEDYRIAAEEGSTMVRIGTALFGSRPSP